jgi:hypothetical protein
MENSSKPTIDLSEALVLPSKNKEILEEGKTEANSKY